MRFNFVLIFLLLSLVTFTSCTKKDSSKVENESFVFRINAEPPTIDPARGVDTVSIDLMNNLNDGLIGFDRDMKTRPAIAEKYEISKDGKTYTFTLRKDVKWSDGVPLKAQHYVDAWERMLNPKTAAEYAYFLYDISGAEGYNTGKIKDFSKVGVKAIDDHTLQVVLRAPAAYWLSTLGFPVMFATRIDLIEKYGDRWTEAGNYQSLGPYKLTKWDHDQQLVMEQNENYYGVKPPIKKAIALIIEDVSTAVSLFEAGKLDLVRKLPTADMDRLNKMPEFGSSVYFRGYYYGFNTKKKPFDDVRVRKAFAHAIDRNELPKILKGGQTAVSSWIPKGMQGYNESIGLKFDPTLAKKLLDEAGFKDRSKLGRIELTYDTREDNKIVAEAIQSMWKNNLGVDVEMSAMEWKMFLEKSRTEASQIFRLGWGADFPDAHNFMDLFLSNSGNNHTKWGSPKYDQLIRKASQERNAENRMKIYDQAQKLLLEEAVAIVPLFVESSNYLLSKRVKDFYLDGMANLFIKEYKLQE